jgi:glycosyltransferase involved in cell wall biosynthesis
VKPGQKEYVYLGRLDPEKRVDLMLRGFARLSDRSARLTIVGEGECRARLELLVAELGLQDRIAFPGRTDDVSRYLRSAHFYLSTSASEGMSNALLEAMSFGVVPLVSDVSGANDIVDHGHNGFLFEPNDLIDFVAKLELMDRSAAMSYRLMSHAARKSILNRFGIDRVAHEHLRIYRVVMDRTAVSSIGPTDRLGAEV